MNGQGDPPALASSRLRLILSLSLIAIALLAGGWLRSGNLDESLWIDELHTSWTVRDGWPALFKRAAWGNQPPLFYGLTKLVQIGVGESEWSLRWVSWVSGFAVIGLGSWLVFRLTGQRTLAAIAAWLLALDVELTFYSQEARPYALVQLCLLLHVTFFVRRIAWRRQRPLPDGASVLSTGRRSVRSANWMTRTGWIVTLWIAFYCHYTALIILVWEALVWLGLAISRTDRRNEVRKFAIDCAIIGAGLLPAGWHVLAIANRQEDWTSIVQLWPLPRQVGQVIILYIFPTLAIGAAGWLTAFRRNSDEGEKSESFAIRLAPRFVTLWGGSLVISVALLWFASRWFGVAWFLPRYFIGLWPLAILLPVLAVACVRSGTVRAWGVVLLLFVAIVEHPMINAPARDRYLAISRHEDWRGAINSLADADPSVQTLFLFPNLVEDQRLDQEPSDEFVQYLQFPVNGMYSLPVENRTNEWRVIVRSLRGDPIFRASDLALVQEEREFQILVRGSQQDVEWVLNELAQALEPNALTFDAMVNGFGSVFVAEVVVMTPEALRTRAANSPLD